MTLRALTAASLALAFLLTMPVSVRAIGYEIYYTRHFTVFYTTESAFARFENTLREPESPKLGRYGPETEFLSEHIEDLYRRVSDALGVYPENFRIEIELVSGRTTPKARLEEPLVSEYLRDGSVYDVRSGTLYFNNNSPTTERVVRGIAKALAAEGYAVHVPRSVVDISVKRAVESIGRWNGPGPAGLP